MHVMYAKITDTSFLIKEILTLFIQIKGLKIGNGWVANLIKSIIKNTTLNTFEELTVILNMKYDNKLFLNINTNYFQDD